SMASLEESRNTEWLSNNFQTYVVLKEGTDPELVNSRFNELIRQYVAPEMEQYLGKSYDELLTAGNYINFSLFHMPDIHLYSDKLEELGANSDIKYIYIFTFIGFFIL